MSFVDSTIRPQNVAIIGSGISGLAAAYLLAPHHSVTVYEAEPRLGGHARTVMAGLRGDQAVDTGFIVFNEVNYPNLLAMFRDLEVPLAKSDMSFGASINQGRIEYGLRGLQSLFAQRRNLSRPAFFRMIRDILRFNARAESFARHEDATVDDLMKDLKLGRWFQDYYLTPLCGAIWSTPADRVRAFPASTLVQFFRNHLLLTHKEEHQWMTVQGGSIEYIRRLEARLRSWGVAIRAGCPVRTVRRTGGSTEVIAANAAPARFDQVIFACHSDQALALLEQPSVAEHSALSKITYQDNRALLHRDVSMMPRRRRVWSSWVYRTESAEPDARIGVTYWMNRLQNIPANDPLFVTLNPTRPVADDMVYDEVTFRHPVFDHRAQAGQRELAAIQGQNNTWFAGAYNRHGFHEDGFVSALDIVGKLDRQTA